MNIATQLQEFDYTPVTGLESHRNFRSAYSRIMSAPHNYGHWATADMRGNSEKPQSAGSAGRQARSADETYPVDTMVCVAPVHVSA